MRETQVNADLQKNYSKSALLLQCLKRIDKLQFARELICSRERA